MNPVTIDKGEQIHAVDGIAAGDSNQPRFALRHTGIWQNAISKTTAQGFQIIGQITLLHRKICTSYSPLQRMLSTYFYYCH